MQIEKLNTTKVQEVRPAQENRQFLVSREVFQKLRLIKKWYWVYTHNACAYERWARKQPQNRVGEKLLIYSKNFPRTLVRTKGSHPFRDAGINDLVNLCRMPYVGEHYEKRCIEVNSEVRLIIDQIYNEASTQLALM